MPQQSTLRINQLIRKGKSSRSSNLSRSSLTSSLRIRRVHCQKISSLTGPFDTSAGKKLDKFKYIIKMTFFNYQSWCFLNTGSHYKLDWPLISSKVLGREKSSCFQSIDVPARAQSKQGGVKFLFILMKKTQKPNKRQAAS